MVELTGWCTIVDVHQATGIPYESIRQAVFNANKKGEQWMVMSTSDHPPRWKLDTDSTAFQHTMLRLQGKLPLSQDQEKQDEGSEDLPTASEIEDFFDFIGDPALAYSLLFPPPPPQETDIVEAWPELCDWLLAQGVLVFSNVLERHTPTQWQWTWGALRGKGHATVKEALLAALQSKVAGGRGDEIVPQESDVTPDTLPVPLSSAPCASAPRRVLKLW